MKICTLIKKDILFCLGWLLAGILVALIAPIYFFYISDLSEILIEPIFALSALLAGNITISRICYIEDNYETRKLLDTMPVFGYQFVLSRYIESFLLTILLMVLIVGMGIMLSVNIHFELILIFIFVGLVYEGLYLLFFYKWGTNIAQYAFIGIIVIASIVYLIINKLNIPIKKVYIDMETSIVLSIIGITLYLISAFLSCKIYKSN